MSTVSFNMKRSRWASGVRRSLHLDGVLRRDDDERVGRASVSPSIVTALSSMASSSADWVLGVARLISSATTTLANTGPLLSSNSPVPLR